MELTDKLTKFNRDHSLDPGYNTHFWNYFYNLWFINVITQPQTPHWCQVSPQAAAPNQTRNSCLFFYNWKFVLVEKNPSPKLHEPWHCVRDPQRVQEADKHTDTNRKTLLGSLSSFPAPTPHGNPTLQRLVPVQSQGRNILQLSRQLLPCPVPKCLFWLTPGLALPSSAWPAPAQEQHPPN